MRSAGKVLCLLAALAFLPAAVAAQENWGDPSPAVKTFNLKQINKGGIKNRIEAWVVTGKRTSVAFYIVTDDYTDYEACSLMISDKGKTSTPVSFWSGTGQDLFDIVALWIPSEEHGLVFLAYATDSGASRANVLVARFNEDGEIISGFRRLHTFAAPSGCHFIITSLAAARRDGRVGLAATAVSNEDSLYDIVGVRDSQGQFFEVDYKGKPKGKLTMRLPGGGSRELAFVFKPIWTGKKWMMPVECTHVALGANSYYPDYYYPYGNALYVSRAEMKSDKLSKSRIKLVMKDDEKDFLTFRNPQFVMQEDGEAPTGATGFFPILYSHRSLLPDTEWRYSRYTYYHGISAVNDKCKKIWGPVYLSLPSWKPGTFTQSNEILANSDCAISYPVPGEDGNFIVAVERHSTWYNHATTSYRAEGIIELFSVDSTTGDLKTLARRKPGWVGAYGRPLVRIFNGHIAVINYYSDYTVTATSYVDFFSRF